MIKADYLDRYDKMQRLNRSVQLRDKQGMGGVFVVSVVAAALLGSTITQCVLKPAPTKECIQCHDAAKQKHADLTTFFKKYGAKTPEMLATACLETRSPRLMAAIAKKEGMVVSSKAGGYKKRHHGAWQVNPKDWGPVPEDPILQARQAEAILEELVNEKKDIRVALNYYGGDKTKKKYAYDVLRELREVPQ